MMESLRYSMPVLIVVAFILPGLLAGSVSAADANDHASRDEREISCVPERSEMPAGPDFAVSNLRVPASVPEQSAYEVCFDVKNLGDSYAGDIRWEVEYRGAILTASEYGSIEGLDRGQIVSVTVELMADVLVDARDEGSVTVIVDPDESTGDADDGNNAAQQSCVVVGGPEFIVSDLFAPSDIDEGGEVDIQFSIRNYGSACESDIEWEVAIQCNEFSRDDVVLAGVVEGLGEGETRRVTASWKTGPGDAGDYVIYAVITTPDDEFDDNEEIRSLRVVADGDLPDLAIVDPHIPERVQPGVEFPVQFIVENLGANCAEEFRYDIVYYDGRTDEDIWYGDVIPGLAMGESVQITDYWVEYHEGDYRIDIMLDESNHVEELTRENNQVRIVYHLPPGMACLYGYGGKVPTTPPIAAGDTVPISFSVFNVGEDYEGVIDWSIRFYNDSDEDEIVGVIDGIKCDETKDVDTSWEVPQGWEGEYHTVLDLNPNARPDYVFEPFQNTGTCTIVGRNSEDSEIRSDASSTEKSTADSDVCTSCAAKGENDSAIEDADQESSDESDEPSSGGSSTAMLVSADAADEASQAAGGIGGYEPSAHHSHMVEAEPSELQSTISGMESQLDGIPANPGNTSSDTRDPGTNTAANSFLSERGMNEIPGDDPETDAWAAMWNALVEGDVWSFFSHFYDLLVNGTVSCAAPFGADQ